MATIKFFIYSKESQAAPIFVKLSAGRQAPRLIVKTGLFVDSDKWSDKSQSIKQRDLSDADKKLIQKLHKLRAHIEGELNDLYETPTLAWFQRIVENCFKKRSTDVKSLSDYIEAYIQEAKDGTRKNKSGMNVAPGTARAWEGFKRIFLEYQGIYTEKRLKELTDQEKKPRPLRIMDYDNITLTFYEDFRNFLIEEGYIPNTVGRFIKALKFFMLKSLNEQKHSNRDFQNNDHFKVLSEEAFTISLTPEEIDKIYKKDLHIYPRLDLARDCFIVLCETAVRISDYPKISLNIKETRGVKLIHITQTKTGTTVTIPLTKRLEQILNKYNGNLPRIPDQHVNYNIKIIARMCGIDEVLRWEATKYGKRYTKTAKKWELISCHCGRRSAATNMFLAGIEPIKIMRLTGHKSEREFMKYIRITEEQVALELAKHPYFNKLRVV